MTETNAIKLAKSLIKKHKIHNCSVQIVNQGKLHGRIEEYNRYQRVLGECRNVFVANTGYVKNQIFLWRKLVEKGTIEANKQNIIHEITHIWLWQKIGAGRYLKLNKWLGNHGIHFAIVGLFLGLDLSERWKNENNFT